MSECRHIKECAFYNDRIQVSSNTAEFMKFFFCRQRPEYCLRLKNARALPLESSRNTMTPASRTFLTPEHPNAD